MTDTPRLLIVGATGRVGRLLAASWRMAPPEGVSITLQSRHPGAEGLVWAPDEGPAALSADIAANGPFAAMMVLAGATPATGADMQINVSVAEACVAAAGQVGIPRVLLASSSAVYGPGTGTPFTEADTPAPVNDYGRAKLAMETACARRGVVPDLCMLRIGNVAGADALLLNAAKATPQAPVRIDRFATGTGPIRNYIGPATMARVLEALCLSPGPLPHILNFAAPDPVAMDDLARAAGFPWTFVPAPDTAIHRVTLDCTRLAALYPFTAADSDPARMVAQVRAAA